MLNDIIFEYDNIIANLKIGQYPQDKKLLNNIKRVVLNNKKNEEVIRCKKKLARLIYHEYTKDEVINAFNIPFEYKYSRELTIIKNDPLFKNPYMHKILVDTIFESTNCYSFEDGIKNYLKECKEEFINDEDFNDQNFNIEKVERVLERYIVFHECHGFSGAKEKIGSLEDEEKRYIKTSINNDYTDPDYMEYIKNHSDGDLKTRYKKEKLSNIGKIYLYNTLVPKETVFVSRDIGDNFGYNIYSTIYTEDSKIDALYTVKATDEDNMNSFTLTNKEKATMLESLKYPKSKYIVCLMCLDLVNTKPNERNHNNIYLQAINETTFIDIANNDEYKLNKHNEFVNTNINLEKTKKIDF